MSLVSSSVATGQRAPKFAVKQRGAANYSGGSWHAELATGTSTRGCNLFYPSPERNEEISVPPMGGAGDGVGISATASTISWSGSCPRAANETRRFLASRPTELWRAERRLPSWLWISSYQQGGIGQGCKTLIASPPKTLYQIARLGAQRPRIAGADQTTPATISPSSSSSPS